MMNYFWKIITVALKQNKLYFLPAGNHIYIVNVRLNEFLLIETELELNERKNHQ